MFKALGALGDMGKMMQQAQEMQQKMVELQERLETIEIEGGAGAGMVTAICTAKGTLKKVTIDPSSIAVEEKEVLEDLIVAAVADAQAKAKQRAEDELKEATAGFPMPPGLGLPT